MLQTLHLSFKLFDAVSYFSYCPTKVIINHCNIKVVLFKQCARTYSNRSVYKHKDLAGVPSGTKSAARMVLLVKSDPNARVRSAGDVPMAT